jgi:hypothetical protein
MPDHLTLSAFLTHENVLHVLTLDDWIELSSAFPNPNHEYSTGDMRDLLDAILPF